jgi:small GTP-binding protein
MGRLRWLLILTGALVAVVALVILVDVLARFHATLTLISPLLANGVLLLIGVLLVAVIATGGYYLLLFTRPRRRRRPPAQPRNPQEAARASLSAVEQQLDQIADTVAQQALREQSQALAAGLERGVLRLVVFGTGSAGKTSLINALLGEVAGDTGAPLGTTLERQRYPLTLEGVSQTLELVDTPGLAEVGPTGTARGQQARQWATEADLLLFVVDNDLRQSEYGPLRTLLEMGKRSLVVLNKTDLYLEMEVRQICDRIAQALSDQLPPEDVVAVAANPKPVTMTDGDQWQPAPEVWPLVTRPEQ